MSDANLQFERNFVVCRIKRGYAGFLKILIAYSVPLIDIVGTLWLLYLIFTKAMALDLIVLYCLVEFSIGFVAFLFLDEPFSSAHKGRPVEQRQSAFEQTTQSQVHRINNVSNDLWMRHYRAFFVSEIFFIGIMAKILAVTIVSAPSISVLLSVGLMIPIILGTFYLVIDWVCTIEKFWFVSSTIKRNPAFANGFDLNPPASPAPEEPIENVVNQYNQT